MGGIRFRLGAFVVQVQALEVELANQALQLLVVIVFAAGCIQFQVTGVSLHGGGGDWLWFRLACPTGRLKLNALRITEKMAIFEAKVYRDREDAEPLSSYVANCTLDATPGGLYVEAAQEEALDTALSNAGFGIQFTDVGSESEEYGSEVPVGAKAEIAKPVQTKVEVAEPVQKQPESVKATPQESAKTDPLDAIMADDMPVPEQVTAEVVEKPKTVVLESVQSAQTPPEPTQNVIVLEQEPPAAAYTQSSPVEEIRRQMTYEQAQNVIVDCGTCKGWTLAQVADRRPASLRWYVKGYQGENNILRAAAAIIWDSLQEKQAG